MLDLPPPGHLLDDQLGVHPDLDLGGPEVEDCFESRDQPAVFGHVVRSPADGFASLGEHLPVHRIEDQRAVPGRTGIPS